MRDRLIELLKSKYDHYCDQCGVNKDSQYIENLADYLLANGVILPEKEDVSPCLNCVEGWATASANGIKSCHDNCWKLQKGR